MSCIIWVSERRQEKSVYIVFLLPEFFAIVLYTIFVYSKWQNITIATVACVLGLVADLIYASIHIENKDFIIIPFIGTLLSILVMIITGDIMHSLFEIANKK